MTSCPSPATRRPHAPSRIRPIAAFARVAVLAGFPICGAALAQTAPADQSLPSVTVSAKQEADIGPQLQKKASGGALGSKSQLDTPFSTTVVSGEDLADRQVTKIGDVFFNDASRRASACMSRFKAGVRSEVAENAAVLTGRLACAESAMGLVSPCHMPLMGSSSTSSG